MNTPPADTPILTWRPTTLEDIPSIVTFAAAVDAVERIEFAGGPEYWKWWLGQHDLETDTLLAIGPDDRVVALGGSFGTNTDRGARAILWLDVHPDRLDLEQPLLEWAIGRGRSQVAASTHAEKVVRVSAEEHRDRRRSLLEASGFVEARAFVEMERSLADDLPEPGPLPDGIEVVPWTPGHDEAGRLVSNASFADHCGSLPIDPETWGSSVLDDDVTRRDLSFLAVAEGASVAICLIEVDLEEDPSKMWVERVGTVPQWQRRGLAPELLTRSMRAAAATGLLTAGLSVDEESLFDATALYTGLGFTVKSRSITYLLEDPS